MNPTQQVARRYYDAWTSGDRHTVTSVDFGVLRTNTFVRTFPTQVKRRPRTAGQRPPAGAEPPGRRASPHRNACRLHDLTGQ
jgi:hypothetical protein